MPFNYTIHHESGKNFIVTDALSRAPVKLDVHEECCDVLEIFVESDANITIPIRNQKALKVNNIQIKPFIALRECILTSDWSKFKNTDYFRE